MIAALLGLLRLAVGLRLGDEFFFFVVSAGSFGALFLILRARRRFREEP